MASVFIDPYHIHYSAVDGRIMVFEEWINNEYIPVVNNYEKKLEEAIKMIKDSDSFKEYGYPAFVDALEGVKS